MVAWLLPERHSRVGQRHPRRRISASQTEDIFEARKMIGQSIDIYNQRRPHLSLKYKTPDAVHQAFFDS